MPLICIHFSKWPTFWWKEISPKCTKISNREGKVSQSVYRFPKDDQCKLWYFGPMYHNLQLFWLEFQPPVFQPLHCLKSTLHTFALDNHLTPNPQWLFQLRFPCHPIHSTASNMAYDISHLIIPNHWLSLLSSLT